MFTIKEIVMRVSRRNFWRTALLGLFMAGMPVMAQTSVRICQIQGTGAASPLEGEEVRTEGVVTLALFGDGQLGGFFIQDTLGDGDAATSDGLFVYGRENVQAGDYVALTGTVTEYNGKTELTSVRDLEVLKQGVGIPYVPVSFPEGLVDSYEAYEGMALMFTNPLYLNSTYDLRYDGSLELGSERLRSPTDYVEPGSEDYQAVLASNRQNRLVLDDGSTYRNPSPTPFLDQDGTCRTGQRVDTLYCVLDEVYEEYKVYAAEEIRWKGNARAAMPDEAALGDYALKVCGYNLEMFFADEAVQTERIVKLLDAVDADLFGLVEVGGGSAVITALVEALNEAKGREEYDYIRWAGHEQSSTYTLNHIVYRKSKLEPFGGYFMINSVNPLNRKLVQGFREIASGEAFVYSINHFKSKSGSGSGADADQGDGQGEYNSRRRQEAYAVVNKLSELRYHYETDRILVMGDLNSLYMEDPIRIFVDKGYEDQVHRFEPDSYTYCYDGQVQFLDYSLASAGMQPYVTGATVWHVNADEPSFLDYDRDETHQSGPYRASDHDPVIVGLNFSNVANAFEPSASAMEVRLWPNPASDAFHVESSKAVDLSVYTLQGALVYRSGQASARHEVEAAGWSPGCYVVVARNRQGGLERMKLTVL